MNICDITGQISGGSVTKFEAWNRHLDLNSSFACSFVERNAGTGVLSFRLAREHEHYSIRFLSAEIEDCVVECEIGSPDRPWQFAGLSSLQSNVFRIDFQSAWFLVKARSVEIAEQDISKLRQRQEFETFRKQLRLEADQLLENYSELCRLKDQGKVNPADFMSQKAKIRERLLVIDNEGGLDGLSRAHYDI